MAPGIVVAVLILLLVRAETALGMADTTPVLMDARFSGFDAIAHVRQIHPELAARAEAISHWAGYYSVNPILLARIVLESPAPDSDAVAALARALAAVATPSDAANRSLARDDSELARRLAERFPVPLDRAGKLIAESRADMQAAGLWRTLAVTAEAPPALDLPFAPPQAWQFNGVHTWTGDDNGSPMSSLDLSLSWSQEWGDDTSNEWVAAAHDGEVTVYSGCFVQVQHPNGWGTRYYHLDNVAVATGQQVRAGDPLANYANNEAQALCSGGHSSEPHLHFALLRDGSYTSLQDVRLSGYQVHPGNWSYDSHRDRMWLEKRGQRYYAYDANIATEPGDNTIDYRYTGAWYAPQHDGHGLTVAIMETAAGERSRKTVFVVMYTYDDAGAANFYAGNRDFERWRSDEAQEIDLLQTAGGDLTFLQSIDFDDPAQVVTAGRIDVRFLDCNRARADLVLDERTSGQPVAHTLELVRLIGVPQHVCDAASLPLP